MAANVEAMRRAAGGFVLRACRIAGVRCRAFCGRALCGGALNGAAFSFLDGSLEPTKLKADVVHRESTKNRDNQSANEPV